LTPSPSSTVRTISKPNHVAFLGILGIIGNQITFGFVFLNGFGEIIGNQIMFFLKGLAIKVGGLSDAVAFTALPVKDRNGEPERGEWMGADKNSPQEFGL
jgi:hypothetical protein